MKAVANVDGNHVVPVKVLNVEAGMLLTIGAGILANNDPTGLYPRSAENRADVAGMLFKSGAKFAAPILVREDVISAGNLWVIPTMSTVKNRPILTVKPVFMRV